MVRYTLKLLNTCCDHSLETSGSVSSEEDQNMFFWSNMESELFTGDSSTDNYSSGDSHSPGYNPCYPSYLEHRNVPICHVPTYLDICN